MLETLFVTLVLAVVGVLFAASRKPDEFRVSRCAVLDAQPGEVFPHINTLKKWEAWSPWAKLDPNAQESFEGPDEGLGSKMSWSGNNKVGQGSMEIVESVPGELIRFKLIFVKPMKAENTAEFRFEREGQNKTQVTWMMSGRNNFMGKVFNVFVNCEKMVGKQFDSGLSSLNDVVRCA